jgi:hypothetical protein
MQLNQTRLNLLLLLIPLFHYVCGKLVAILKVYFDFQFFLPLYPTNVSSLSLSVNFLAVREALTSWSSALLKKLPAVQLLKNFPAF